MLPGDLRPSCINAPQKTIMPTKPIVHILIVFDCSIDAMCEPPLITEATAIFVLILTEGYFWGQYAGRDMSAVQH